MRFVYESIGVLLMIESYSLRGIVGLAPFSHHRFGKMWWMSMDFASKSARLRGSAVPQSAAPDFICSAYIPL